MVNSQLEKISQTDGLTGLKNRRYFDERFQQEWDKSLEQQSPLSIIMIDIDFFKKFNDYYGHPEGDTCLKKIGSALMESMNHENDVAARYGGEEFVVLLPNTDTHAAYKMAKHIRNTVNTLKIEHKHSAVNEYVTISLGVNTQVASQDSLKEAFMKKADKALYLAKEKGRDTIEVGGQDKDGYFTGNNKKD
jgi:diguanylate cyclase (GGDEF)-like protein